LHKIERAQNWNQVYRKSHVKRIWSVSRWSASARKPLMWQKS